MGPYLASVNDKILDFERIILGSIIWEPEQIERAKLQIRPEDFRYERHGIIFRSMLGLAENGVEIDLYNLYEFLDRAGDLKLVGGSQYLIYLMELVFNDVKRRADFQYEILWKSWQLA